ncbi:ABC transporter ATP-binding protein [Edwardsiella piscicida]|uniref:ABC transporter ATP-binding protein n=1 Tax=Edwardsiella piscicida TaxID=1263550 RepID=UPI00370D78E5
MFSLTNLEVVRGGREVLAIEHLTIPTDRLTVILGHNGSGKSTLVSLLAGQLRPDGGQIALDGQALSSLSAGALARRVAFLPQKLPASAGLTVRELVRLGRFPWRGMLGRWRREDRQLIDAAMAETGVAPFADTLVDTLSGGERQRAWVAMLLAQASPLLILDQPTSALDIQHQYQLMALLSALPRGVLVILHDLNLALRYADHVIALKQGRVAFAGSAAALADEQRLSDLYQTPIRLTDHPHPTPGAPPHKVAIICA